MLPIISLGIILIVILGLPPLGILFSENTLFPQLFLFSIPTTPGTSSIAWSAFGIVAALITSAAFPYLWRLHSFHLASKPLPPKLQGFPWWGWFAGFWVFCSWCLAWSRLSWFAFWQAHTFSMLWFGYIVLLNALTYQRSTRCLILNRPRFLVCLFSFSAGFWWTFEYLNQFVKNWHYVNIPETSHVAYIFCTSISFATVLPTILSTYEWLKTFPQLTEPFKHWHPIPWIIHQNMGWLFLSLGSVGLFLIGIWPNLLFPLIWLSPLFLLLGSQIILKEPTFLQGVVQGDWRSVTLSALAALVCGFWWELWNAYSFVHWEYTIPHVHAFEIFEMPLLGYSGYLPFGILCLAVTEIGLGYRTNHPSIGAFQTRQDNGR